MHPSHGYNSGSRVYPGPGPGCNLEAGAPESRANSGPECTPVWVPGTMEPSRWATPSTGNFLQNHLYIYRVWWRLPADWIARRLGTIIHLGHGCNPDSRMYPGPVPGCKPEPAAPRSRVNPGPECTPVWVPGTMEPCRWATNLFPKPSQFIGSGGGCSSIGSPVDRTRRISTGW